MAGAALAVGVLAVSASLAVACAAAGAASVEAVRLSLTADAAALAAADVLSGAVTGIPCERARQIAARVGAGVESCELHGAEATVALTSRLGPFTAQVRARAGPPSFDRP